MYGRGREDDALVARGRLKMPLDGHCAAFRTEFSHIFGAEAEDSDSSSDEEEEAGEEAVVAG